MKNSTYVEIIINSLNKLIGTEFNIERYLKIVNELNEYYPSDKERDSYSLSDMTLIHNNVKAIREQIDLLDNKSFVWLYLCISETIISKEMSSCKCALHIFLGSTNARERVETIVSTQKDKTWYQNAFYQLLNLDSSQKSAATVELEAV
ncbi:hypothetical protein [Priestia aryabhattai]